MYLICFSALLRCYKFFYYQFLPLFLLLFFCIFYLLRREPVLGFSLAGIAIVPLFLPFLGLSWAEVPQSLTVFMCFQLDWVQNHIDLVLYQYTSWCYLCCHLISLFYSLLNYLLFWFELTLMCFCFNTLFGGH